MLKRFMCLFCLVFTASSVHAEDLLGLYKASLEADPALRSMQFCAGSAGIGQTRVCNKH